LKQSLLIPILLVILLLAPIKAFPSEINDVTFSGEISSAAHRLGSEAVDLVVFIDEEPDLPAGRKVREVVQVLGYEDGRYIVESL